MRALGRRYDGAYAGLPRVDRWSLGNEPNQPTWLRPQLTRRRGTNPLDATLGVSLARQAAYLNQSDWIAFRNPRVHTVAQYKLADDPAVSGFQSGGFSDGRLKPSYGAYRLPLWVTPKGVARLRVHGQVRPLPAGATAWIEVQNAPLADGEFTTVAGFTVRSGRPFVRSIPRSQRRFRLRWAAAGLHSRNSALSRPRRTRDEWTGRLAPHAWRSA